MLIAVIGGTGMVGTAVVRSLAGEHEIRILSRRPPDTLPAGVSHHPVDLVSREGLGAALSGVETVVDVANARKSSKKVLVDGTADLLDRCQEAAVDHYVGISIVGCERLGLGYYAAKAAQEEVIRAAPIGWSLLRATQFHELLDVLFGVAARFRLSPVASIPLQPVAAAAVAGQLARLATGEPALRTETITGPRIETLRDLSDQWREARRQNTLRLPIRLPGKSGRALRAGAFTDLAAPRAGADFGEWLAGRDRRST